VLSAAMVGADSQIPQGEIAVAESIGSAVLPGFDQVEFRECCNNLGNIGAFNDVVDILAPLLKDENRKITHNYLKEISMADGELSDEEKGLLLCAEKQWGIEADPGQAPLRSP
jgi:hypothetical protein